jgi:superoxide dismutase
MTVINCELKSCQSNKEGVCIKEEIKLHWDGHCIDYERKSNILIGINFEKHTWGLRIMMIRKAVNNIERSVNMTLKYVDMQVSTHTFFK